MKKKDLNYVEKKKKPVNQQKDKTEEKTKDKKLISPYSSSERPNPLMNSSQKQKSKKIRTLTEQPSSNLSRKKSEQKCKVETKYLDEKNTKKDKQRTFSHSPNKIPNKINEKQKLID